MTPPDLDSLDDLDRAAPLASAFSRELRGLQADLARATADLGRLEQGLSTGLRRAIDGLVLDGDRLGDALRTLARSLADTAYAAATRPVTDRAGALIGQAVGNLMGMGGPAPAQPKAPQVTLNVSTPDAGSFARSQGQIAAELSRLLARGARNR